MLLLIFTGVWRRSGSRASDQKIFLGLVVSTALLLFFDAAMWTLNGHAGMVEGDTFRLVTMGYYFLNPVPCILWAMYVDLQIFRDPGRLKKLMMFYLAPFAVSTILSVTSVWTGFLFRIDGNNTYARGEGFMAMAMICYGYLVVTIIQILRWHRSIRREEFGPLLLFALPPMIGGIVQILFFGVTLIWPSLTISLLVIYMMVQNKRIHTDHLTGLHNRRQLDEYLDRRLRDRKRGGLLGGIMIDVDSFKEINDQYGHSTGDEALEQTSDILRESLRREDFICRYGGDEFAVMIKIHRFEDLTRAVERIRETADRFNKRHIAPYEIQLSCGYDMFDFSSDLDEAVFLDRIDHLMYTDKKMRSPQTEASDT